MSLAPRNSNFEGGVARLANEIFWSKLYYVPGTFAKSISLTQKKNDKNLEICPLEKVLDPLMQ